MMSWDRLEQAKARVGEKGRKGNLPTLGVEPDNNNDDDSSDGSRNKEPKIKGVPRTKATILVAALNRIAKEQDEDSNILEDFNLQGPTKPTMYGEYFEWLTTQSEIFGVCSNAS